MSYCRFSSGDVYLFLHTDSHIECCACSLAPKTPSIFTSGCGDHPLFGDLPPCPICVGEGCEDCMMPGSMQFYTFDDAINHLLAHREAGDFVPEYALDRLYREKAEYGTLENLFDSRDEN